MLMLCVNGIPSYRLVAHPLYASDAARAAHSASSRLALHRLAQGSVFVHGSPAATAAAQSLPEGPSEGFSSTADRIVGSLTHMRGRVSRRAGVSRPHTLNRGSGNALLPRLHELARSRVAGSETTRRRGRAGPPRPGVATRREVLALGESARRVSLAATLQQLRERLRGGCRRDEGARLAPAPPLLAHGAQPAKHALHGQRDHHQRGCGQDGYPQGVDGLVRRRGGAAGWPPLLLSGGRSLCLLHLLHSRKLSARLIGG